MEAGVRTEPRAQARAAAWRTVVRDYLTLTKPKVQSLLLFTTVTTMYVAGDPSLGRVVLTCLGGALSAGGAGAGAAAGGLGGDHGTPQRERSLPLRDRLLLDAAALLGAVAAHARRVRAREGADAAGRARRARDTHPDPALLAAAGGGLAAAVRGPALRRPLRGFGAAPGRRARVARARAEPSPRQALRPPAV